MGLEREGEGDEFEVSLELSIGGCYGKSINVVEGGKNRDDPFQENVSRSDFGSCRRDLEKKRKLEEDEVPRISASNWDNNGGCKVSGGSDGEAESSSPDECQDPRAIRSNVIKRLKADNSNPQIQPSTPQVHCTTPSLPFTKPPKPQNHKTQGGPAQQMPCVTTTGNGPHGKTVTGFLCKYTKSEVSIVCVCHGRFFSPAEFVEHGGGVNVVNPLRHITIVNSVKR